MLTECPCWCAGADFEVVTSRASLDENQIGMLFNVCSAHIVPRCAAPLSHVGVLVFAPPCVGWRLVCLMRVATLLCRTGGHGWYKGTGLGVEPHSFEYYM